MLSINTKRVCDMLKKFINIFLVVILATLILLPEAVYAYDEDLVSVAVLQGLK